MNQSLRVRKEKVLARKRLRERFARGEVRLEDFCVAAQSKLKPETLLVVAQMEETSDEWFEDE